MADARPTSVPEVRTGQALPEVRASRVLEGGEIVQGVLPWEIQGN